MTFTIRYLECVLLHYNDATCYGVSNHRQIDCLFNSRFWPTTKASKLRNNDPFAGTNRYQMDSAQKEPVMQKAFPCQTLRETCYYSDVIMSTMASEITSVSIVCWTVGSGADQRKGPGTRKCFHLMTSSKHNPLSELSYGELITKLYELMGRVNETALNSLRPSDAYIYASAN